MTMEWVQHAGAERGRHRDGRTTSACLHAPTQRPRHTICDRCHHYLESSALQQNRTEQKDIDVASCRGDLPCPQRLTHRPAVSVASIRREHRVAILASINNTDRKTWNCCMPILSMQTQRVNHVWGEKPCKSGITNTTNKSSVFIPLQYLRSILALLK